MLSAAAAYFSSDTSFIPYVLLCCFIEAVALNGKSHIAFLQTHLTFGKEFTEAVEMKQVAQQEAERARFVVEKVSVHPS